MTQQASDPNFAITRPQPKEVEFVPFGGGDKIKLSVAIIQNLIAVPTKTGKTCSERDAMKFLMLCRSRGLNPFEGDAFLIGYDSQDGPTFSLITAHQAFLKRAELHPEYDGMESGVIISPALACPMCSAQGGREVSNNWVVCSACKGVGQTDEIEGDIIPSESQLIGGWAKVHFKQRKVLTKKRLSIKTFNKGFGRWRDDPAGMIVKCAEADALRSSFPTKFGGMYLREEQELPVHAVATPVDLEMPREQKALVDPRTKESRQPALNSFTDQQETKPEPAKTETKVWTQDMANATKTPADQNQSENAMANAASSAPATTDKPATKKGPKPGSLLGQLRASMTLDSLSDEEVLAYMQRKHGIPPETTLETIGDTATGWILKNFDTVAGQIRIDRKGEQQPT